MKVQLVPFDSENVAKLLENVTARDVQLSAMCVTASC